MQSIKERPKAANAEKPTDIFKIGERAKKILLNSLALDELSSQTALGENYHLVETLRNDISNPKYQSIYGLLVDFANIWNQQLFQHDLSLDQKTAAKAQVLKKLNKQIISVFNLKTPDKGVKKLANNIVKFVRPDPEPPLTPAQLAQIEQYYNDSDWNPQNDVEDWGDAVDNAMYAELDERIVNLRDQQKRQREYQELSLEWSQNIFSFLEVHLGANLIKHIFADCLVHDSKTNTQFYELNNVFSPDVYYYFIQTRNTQDRINEFYGRLFEKIIFRLDGNNHSEARKLLSTILLHGLSEDSKKTLDSLNLCQISGSFSLVDITEKQYADLGKVFQHIIQNPPTPDDVENYPQYVDPELPEEPVNINPTPTSQPDSSNLLKSINKKLKPKTHLNNLRKHGAKFAENIGNQLLQIPGVEKKLSQLKDYVGLNEEEYDNPYEIKNKFDWLALNTPGFEQSLNYNIAALIDNQGQGEDEMFFDHKLGISIVADGVSHGGNGGDMSRWLVNHMAKKIKEVTQSTLNIDKSPHEWLDFIKNELNKAVNDKDMPENGQTTISIVKIVGKCAVVVTIGDSMVYKKSPDTSVRLLNNIHSTEIEKIKDRLKSIGGEKYPKMLVDQICYDLQSLILKYPNPSLMFLNQDERYALEVVWTEIMHESGNVNYIDTLNKIKNQAHNIFSSFPQIYDISTNVVSLRSGDQIISMTDGAENIGYEFLNKVLNYGEGEKSQNAVAQIVEFGKQTKQYSDGKSDDCTVQIISVV